MALFTLQNLFLTLVILSLLSFDIVSLTLSHPTPNPALRIVLEILAYGSLAVLLVMIGHTGQLCLTAGIRRTAFYRDILQSAQDTRIYALFPSQPQPSRQSNWQRFSIWHLVYRGVATIQFVVCLFALARLPGEDFIKLLVQHLKWFGIATLAAAVLPILSLALLFTCVANLYCRNTDEEYRFYLGSSARIYQRIIFGLFIYLVLLQVSTYVFDPQSTMYSLSAEQILFFGPLNIVVGALSIFTAVFSLMSERVARWIQSLVPMQEKVFFSPPKPYFLPVTSFSMLPLAMVMGGWDCLLDDGSSYMGLLPGLILALLAAVLALVVFGLDVAICYGVIFWGRWGAETSEHMLLAQHEEGDLEAGTMVTGPTLILTSPDDEEDVLIASASPRKTSAERSYEDTDDRFVLEAEEDDEEDAPLLENAS